MIRLTKTVHEDTFEVVDEYSSVLDIILSSRRTLTSVALLYRLSTDQPRVISFCLEIMCNLSGCMTAATLEFCFPLTPTCLEGMSLSARECY